MAGTLVHVHLESVGLLTLLIDLGKEACLYNAAHV